MLEILLIAILTIQAFAVLYMVYLMIAEQKKARNREMDELKRYRVLASVMADACRDRNTSHFAHAACHIIRMTGRWSNQEARQ